MDIEAEKALMLVDKKYDIDVSGEFQYDGIKFWCRIEMMHSKERLTPEQVIEFGYFDSFWFCVKAGFNDDWVNVIDNDFGFDEEDLSPEDWAKACESARTLDGCVEMIKYMAVKFSEWWKTNGDRVLAEHAVEAMEADD